mmetsp:Transcript_25562/g.53798  ORF Transcript_25562/g.53798 Transcript_25562/m.53798 type:complete len:171 (-) Transcript_25562:519-1031(-)
MSEPFATFLMPIYASISWLLLLFRSHRGQHLLPISLIGWIWAMVNIIRTKRLDLGIVTFGIVLLGTLVEVYMTHKVSSSSENISLGRVWWIKWWLTIGCILVAANFSLVVIFWDSISKELEKSKSQTWMKVFLSYCIIMMVFWIAAAFKNQVRGENIPATYASLDEALAK